MRTCVSTHRGERVHIGYLSLIIPRRYFGGQGLSVTVKPVHLARVAGQWNFRDLPRSAPSVSPCQLPPGPEVQVDTIVPGFSHEF